MAVSATHAVQTESPLDDAITSATLWLDEEQDAEGFWVGMLESNSCMEAEWLLLMHFIG